MKIKIYNFTLSPAQYAVDRFDLTGDFPSTTFEGEPTITNRLIGYALSLESCIRTITTLTTEANFKDENVSLKQYVDEYKRIKTDVDNILK